MREKNPDAKTVKDALILKCDITDIKYAPDLIFDEFRLSEVKKYWNVALSRLTKDLPSFDGIIAELRIMLRFL